MNENNKTNTKKETTMNNNALTNKENLEAAILEKIQPGNLYMEDYTFEYFGKHFDSIADMLDLHQGKCFLVLGKYDDMIWGFEEAWCEHAPSKCKMWSDFRGEIEFTVEGEQKTLTFRLREVSIPKSEFRNIYKIKVPTKANKQQIADIMTRMTQIRRTTVCFEVKDDPTEDNHISFSDITIRNLPPKVGAVYIKRDGKDVKDMRIIVGFGGKFDDVDKSYEVLYVTAVPVNDDTFDRNLDIWVDTWNWGNQMRLQTGIHRIDNYFVGRGGWELFGGLNMNEIRRILVTEYAHMGTPVKAPMYEDQYL